MSDPYRLECGVRQGGLTSPTLFNLYMDDLIVALSRQHVDCHVDGVCVNNISYADDMVLLSASISGMRQLAIGTKCPPNSPPVLLSGVPLKMVEQFKYLGHIATTCLKDDADIERERRALSVRARSLWADYTKKRYSDLRVLYNNAFRILLGLPRCCSASGMFADAITDCFHTTMRKRCASFVRRVRGSQNSVLKMIAERFDCFYLRHCCDKHLAIQMPERKL
ncbi:uncharacterized protein LOC123665347 [Melitaea cinxia]|uniref:uncharacterized protein LOC123665347 n=1 Tax=Melitaea cinxia TaxID=113334 RepID=UPI001E272DEB|nr:uncharacterized protein LOC123665347 [Melitaea cinxia]